MFASQLGLLVDYYCITEVFDNFLGDFEADFFVGLLAAPVEQGYLDLMTGFEELRHLVHLDGQVVRADLEAETHLLHVQRLGAFAVLLQLLGALVIVLTPVNYLGDWRIGIRRDLHQIQLALLRNSQRLLLAQYAELFAVFVNDSDSRCPNLIIQAGVFGYDLSPTY